MSEPEHLPEGLHIEVPEDFAISNNTETPTSKLAEAGVIIAGAVAVYAVYKGIHVPVKEHGIDDSSLEPNSSAHYDAAAGLFTALKLAFKGGRKSAGYVNRPIRESRQNPEGFFGGHRRAAREARLSRGATTGQVASGLVGALDPRRGGTVGERYSAASGRRGNFELMASADHLSEKNAGFAAIKNNDRILWALMIGGDPQQIRRTLETVSTGQFVFPSEIGSGVAHIMHLRSQANENVLRIAATRAQAATGTGYVSPGEMLAWINNATGGDADIADQLLGQMRPLASQSGRPDLGGAGFGILSTVRRRLNEAANNGGVVPGYPAGYTVNVATNEVMQAVIDTITPQQAVTGRESSARLIADAHVQRIENIMLSINNNVAVTVSSSEPDRVATERDLKQAIASAHGLHDVLSSAAPQNAHVYADTIMGRLVPLRHLTTEMRTALAPFAQIGNQNIRGSQTEMFVTYKQIMETLAGQDEVYSQMRRDFYTGVTRPGNPPVGGRPPFIP